MMAPRWMDYLKLAGYDLTTFLLTTLEERGYTFQLPRDREIVQDIKERISHVELDFDQEMYKASMSSDLEGTYAS